MTNGQRQQDRCQAENRKDGEGQQRQGNQGRHHRRTAARKAYRAKIESLLDESRDERLAEVWQRVCPFPIDPACELPDRRGIIEDLADFAVVLQPSLDGMKADRLCRLIEKYAACESRQFDLPVVHTTSPDEAVNWYGEEAHFVWRRATETSR